MASTADKVVDLFVALAEAKKPKPLRIPLRKVVSASEYTKVSRDRAPRTVSIRFYTYLQLECGHEVRVAGMPSRWPDDPNAYWGEQKCKECHAANKAARKESST